MTRGVATPRVGVWMSLHNKKQLDNKQLINDKKIILVKRKLQNNSFIASKFIILLKEKYEPLSYRR